MTDTPIVTRLHDLAISGEVPYWFYEPLTDVADLITELTEALEKAKKALTAPTIGTINMDCPDWYGEVDAAVVAIDTALAKAGGQ